MKTDDPIPPRRTSARVVMALAYFAGISLIVGWSLSEGVAADRRSGVEKARRPAPSTPAPSPLRPVADTGKGQSRTNCAGCGVIESVQRIDTPTLVMGGCHADEGVGISWRPVDPGGPDAPDALADTVASVLADGRGRKKVAVDTRHRIVVRFRDGSRQVFDEATPRSLRVGDRIVVIAGKSEAKGAPMTRTAASGDLWRSVRSRTDG